MCRELLEQDSHHFMPGRITVFDLSSSMPAEPDGQKSPLEIPDEEIPAAQAVPNKDEAIPAAPEVPQHAQDNEEADDEVPTPSLMRQHDVPDVSDGNFDGGFKQRWSSRWSSLSLNTETLEKFGTLLERARAHISNRENMANSTEQDPT